MGGQRNVTAGMERKGWVNSFLLVAVVKVAQSVSALLNMKDLGIASSEMTTLNSFKRKLKEGDSCLSK